MAEARREMDRAFALARRTGDLRLVALLNLQETQLRLAEGRPELALENVREAEKFVAMSSDAQTRILLAIRKAHVARALGRPFDEHVAVAAEMVRRLGIGERGFLARAVAELGR